MKKPISLVALALLLVACSGGGDRPDGDVPSEGGTDAGLDAGDDGDVGEDADVGEDGDVQADGDVPDGGEEEDGGLPPVGGEPTCLEEGVACSGGACDVGFTCVTSACGGSICARAGRPCYEDADCPTGSFCDPDSGLVCRPTNGEVCNDARDCPMGFECEGDPGDRTCVSRRVPCNAELACPAGYDCRSPTPGDARFCVYELLPCAGNKVCRSDMCVDTDGDGDTECAALNVSGLACSPSGTACGGDDVCRDLHGGGQAVCSESGGCAGPADCPAHALCLALGDAAPACVTGF